MIIILNFMVELKKYFINLIEKKAVKKGLEINTFNVLLAFMKKKMRENM